MKTLRSLFGQKPSLNYPFFLSCFLIAAIFLSCKHTPEPLFPAVIPGGTAGGGNTPDLKDSICFEEEIKPLLVSNCAASGCHDDTTRAAGVVLVSHERLMATVSGNLLLQSIQDPGDLGMPPLPRSRLTDDQIQSIRKWIREGMKQDIDCAGICDSSNITFAGTVNPIIRNNCLSCHNGNSQGQTDLSSYAAIKVQAGNGKLNCTIHHIGDCMQMPPGAPLSECNLDQIRKWIEAGAPNN